MICHFHFPGSSALPTARTCRQSFILRRSFQTLRGWTVNPITSRHCNCTFAPVSPYTFDKMKFSLVTLTLVAAISAIPHGMHDRNTAQIDAAGDIQTPNMPAHQRVNGEGHRGDHRHGGGQNSAPPAPQASAAAAAPPVAGQQGTTTQQGAQPANTAAATNNGNAGQSTSNGSIDPSLVPDFGQAAGQDPDGTGNCKTTAGKTIPCQCPPSRTAFIAKLEQFVSAGSFFGTLAAPFPTGNTNADALARIDTIISALQNFDGSPGKGCPSVSAPNFSVVQQGLLSQGA